MDNSVIIKGYKDGIVLQLDPELPFPELESRIRSKFEASSKFLGNARMAITFKDRTLTAEEQKQVLGIISETTDLEIICVFDNNEENEALLKKSVDEVVGSLSDLSARVFRGVLPEGKTLSSEASLIIVGNVEKGAVVNTGGSVCVLGTLSGTVNAGMNFGRESFVYASVFNPEALTLRGISYSPEPEPVKKHRLFSGKKSEEKHPVLVTVFEDSLSLEPVREETFCNSGELAEFL